MRGTTHRRQSSAFTRNTGSSPNSAHGHVHVTLHEAGGHFAHITNYVSVPMWPRCLAPLIPMVCNALPRMQWALAGAKRLECGSLLPLCFYARTTCLSPCRVIRKTPFAYSALFVVETNQANGSSFPNPLGSMTLSRPAGKSHRLTRPRRP